MLPHRPPHGRRPQARAAPFGVREPCSRRTYPTGAGHRRPPRLLECGSHAPASPAPRAQATGARRAFWSAGAMLPPHLPHGRRPQAPAAPFGVRELCSRNGTFWHARTAPAWLAHSKTPSAGASHAPIPEPFGVQEPCSRRTCPTGTGHRRPPRLLECGSHAPAAPAPRATGALRAPRQHGWRTPKTRGATLPYRSLLAMREPCSRNGAFWQARASMAGALQNPFGGCEPRSRSDAFWSAGAMLPQRSFLAGARRASMAGALQNPFGGRHARRVPARRGRLANPSAPVWLASTNTRCVARSLALPKEQPCRSVSVHRCW